jgi:predicted nucleotidyltransferase
LAREAEAEAGARRKGPTAPPAWADRRRTRRLVRWTFLLPADAYVLFAFAIPIVYNLLLSFEQTSPATISRLTAPFAGLSNYTTTLRDRRGHAMCRRPTRPRPHVRRATASAVPPPWNVSAVRAGRDACGARACPRPCCQVRRRLVDRRVDGATRVSLDEIRAMGPQLAELCRKYGIAELSVFGSVARGDAQPGSDVDLLYVRVPGNDLGMSYFALQEDLEKLFGRPVDLVAKEGLHRVIRDQVLSDAQVLYAA